MTENKGILKKLMGGNINKLDTAGEQPLSDTSRDDNFSSASRIVQVRYRFYAVGVLLVILIVVFWFLLPGRDSFNSKKAEIQTAKTKLEELEARENEYNQSIGFLETVQEEDREIVDCINKGENCDALSKEVEENISLAKTYLLTNGMNETKMDVDERKIIESIDTYLVKLEPFLNNSSTNGTISKISIGDKTEEGGLYTVPVQIDITFDDKEHLLSFIDNVEKYIPESDSIRIMYKIDKISYDIINSEDVQDTSIYMNLYYYDE